MLYLINDLFLMKQKISGRGFNKKTNRYFQCLTSMNLVENYLKLKKKTICSMNSATSDTFLSSAFFLHM